MLEVLIAILLIASAGVFAAHAIDALRSDRPRKIR
jgi:hypothetical protein